MAAFNVTAVQPEPLRNNKIEHYGTESSLLGKGSFGSVHVYSNDHRVYAVKTIKTRSTPELTFSIILAEIAFLTSISHPHIVPIYDVHLDGVNQAKIVMPLATMDLHGLIKTRYFQDRLDHMQIAAAQLISAVAYLTRHNILHRDIKPHNVLCTQIGTSQYTYQLADFSLAQSNICIYDNRDYGKYTLWYRPPELLNRSGSYTEKADVWALGCTLYELLGNGPLFYVPRDIPDGIGYIFNQIRRTWDLATPKREINWSGATSEFRSLILSMVTYSQYARPNIFKVQDHPLFSKPEPYERNEFDAPYIEPLECGMRYLAFTDLISIGGLSSYKAKDLNLVLEWISIVIENSDKLPMHDQIILRTDGLAKIMFLAYVSQTKPKLAKLQLLAVASVFIAGCWFRPYGDDYITLDDLQYVAKGTAPKDQIIRVVEDMLYKNNYHLLTVTPCDVLFSLLSSDYSLTGDLRMLAQHLLLLAQHQVIWFTDPRIAHKCLHEAKTVFDQSLVPDLTLRSNLLAIGDNLEINIDQNVDALWTKYKSAKPN